MVLMGNGDVTIFELIKTKLKPIGYVACKRDPLNSTLAGLKHIVKSLNRQCHNSACVEKSQISTSQDGRNQGRPRDLFAQWTSYFGEALRDTILWWILNWPTHLNALVGEKSLNP